MERPIEVILHEMEQEIAAAINKPGLPACITLPVMERLTENLRAMSAMQTQRALEAWESEANSQKEQQ